MSKLPFKQYGITGIAVVLLILIIWFGIPALQSKIAENAEQEKMSRGIKNLGQIREFSLPPNWKYGGKQEYPQSYVYLWESRSEPVAMISVEAPPDLTSYQAADVMSVLDQAPHLLTPAELQLGGVDMLVRSTYREGSFDILNAQTVDIDGKKVLRVKRKFKDPRLGQDDSLIINADGNGKSFQVIYFWGQADAYEKHHAEAENSFQSLRLDLSYWR